MSESDDQWRHQQPAAPHAPAHDPVTAGLPLSGGQSGWPDESQSDAPRPVARRDSGSIGAILAVAVISFLFAGAIFGTMYPLAAGTAFIAYLLVNGMLSVAAPGLGDDGRRVFALLALVVVFWYMSRLDHKLADTIPLYRSARHIVRLVLIGIFVAVTSIHEFDNGAWPTSSAEVGVLVADPKFWIGLAVTTVVAHLVLKRAEGFREFWHFCMELFRLRAKA